jgi:hypothetical protein
VDLAMNPFRTWAASSQQQSRRNAMIATTSLTQRRVERLEVERYLADVRRRTEVAPTSDREHAALQPPAAHA